MAESMNHLKVPRGAGALILAAGLVANIPGENAAAATHEYSASQPTQAGQKLCRMAVGNTIKFGDTVWMQDGVVKRPKSSTYAGHMVYLGSKSFGEATSALNPPNQWTVANTRSVKGAKRYWDGSRAKDALNCKLPRGVKRPAKDARAVTIDHKLTVGGFTARTYPSFGSGGDAPNALAGFKKGGIGVSFSNFPKGQGFKRVK